MHGVSTRKVDELMKALGLEGVSSRRSRGSSRIVKRVTERSALGRLARISVCTGTVGFPALIESRSPQTKRGNGFESRL